MTKAKALFRPHWMTAPEQSPPKRAPSSDKLAIQDPCCSVMLKWPRPLDVNDNKDDEFDDMDCMEAMAGEVYPLLSPTAKGPNDTAKAANA